MFTARARTNQGLSCAATWPATNIPTAAAMRIFFMMFSLALLGSIPVLLISLRIRRTHIDAHQPHAFKWLT
jgi:hypothetical protein